MIKWDPWLRMKIMINKMTMTYEDDSMVVMIPQNDVDSDGDDGDDDNDDDEEEGDNGIGRERSL